MVVEEVDYNKALEFATEKHKGQVRRVDKTPYINHPIRVADVLKLYAPEDENYSTLLACAYLHDTLEDTNTSFIELKNCFGLLVARIVMEVSTAPFASDEVKTAYLCRQVKYMSSRALTIKLADRLDNISDLANMEKEKMAVKIDQTSKMINCILKSRHLNKLQLTLCTLIKRQLEECKKFLKN